VLIVCSKLDANRSTEEMGKYFENFGYTVTLWLKTSSMEKTGIIGPIKEGVGLKVPSTANIECVLCLTDLGEGILMFTTYSCNNDEIRCK
jgi:hypothetical protein